LKVKQRKEEEKKVEREREILNLKYTHKDRTSFSQMEEEKKKYASELKDDIHQFLK